MIVSVFASFYFLGRAVAKSESRHSFRDGYDRGYASGLARGLDDGWVQHEQAVEAAKTEHIRKISRNPRRFKLIKGGKS